MWKGKDERIKKNWNTLSERERKVLQSKEEEEEEERKGKKRKWQANWQWRIKRR